MKFKTTNKEVKSQSTVILKVGYCNLQTLLREQEATAYTSGVDGWHSDIYYINGVTISTGYQPIGLSIDYAIIKDYESKAIAIASDYNLTWEEQAAKINELLYEFIELVKSK